MVEISGGGYTYDTETELLERMDQLIANPSHRNTLGLKGYNMYCQRWTPDAHIDSYLALVEQLDGAS